MQTSGYWQRRTRLLMLLVAGFAAASCSATTTESIVAAATVELSVKPELATADRASLLAWKETLGPAYPLTIRGRDTVSALVRLIDPANAEWKQTTVPGIALVAEFYAGDKAAGEYGFIETSHGQGGYFVSRVGSTVFSRRASADDIARFMAFFGVGVVIVE
jgi:hypothetical protein